MLRRLLAHETQLTRLETPRWRGLPWDDLSTVYQQLGSLTALRHLAAWKLPVPTSSDCRALKGLQQLTTLAIPLQVCFLNSCHLQHR